MKKLSHDEITVNRSTLETIETADRMPLYIVLDNIRSNYNVGSIFRSSDGAMIEKLILCGYTPHPPKKEILKTALGATQSIKWEYIKDPHEAVFQLKEQGIKICSLELTDNSIPYYNVKPSDFPLCIIVGNEITGVRQSLIDLCDFSIEIPQYGIKQSLNVAVAYGIAIFEMRKKYDLSKG
jgi:tRNA G18 (ribose-2'-O)-methylase SpoU